MSLPNFQNGPNSFDLMQDKWSSILDPIIDNPANKSTLLPSIKLVTGNNTVNHLLSRKLQGWSIVRIDAASTIYDSQTSNSTQDKTLILVASAPCTVTLLVF